MGPAVLRAPLPGFVARLQPGLLARGRSWNASIWRSLQGVWPNLLGRLALAGGGTDGEFKASCIILIFQLIICCRCIRRTHELLDGRLLDTHLPLIASLLRHVALQLVLLLARVVPILMPLNKHLDVVRETVDAVRQSV